MTPDLYAAWLTAAAALAALAWRSIRRAARKVDQILADEQPAHATDTQTRTEKP